MDRTPQQWRFQIGDEVFGADADRVGTITAVHPSFIVVDSGFLAAARYSIPTSAVANYEASTVYLTVTKDEVRDQGWDVEPTDDLETATAPGSDTTTTTSGDVAATDTIRVPVHEEELSATKTPRQIGQVRVEKQVVAEEKVLEVPVTEERVRVERRVVDRPIGADDTAFEGDTIEVPVRGEEVQLQKTVRVVEEVEIGKDTVQRTERAAGTVRREEVRVTEESDETRQDALRDMGVGDADDRDLDDLAGSRDAGRQN
jgi:uncharacterized protein (TIGR02271 family)